MRNPGRGELFAKIIRGQILFATEFRISMEIAPDLGEPGGNPREVALDSL